MNAKFVFSGTLALWVAPCQRSALLEGMGPRSAKTTSITRIAAAFVICVFLHGLGMPAHYFEGATCNTLFQWAHNAQEIWRGAGMRYKIKTLVGFYQCIAAVPSVYDVAPPPGLEEYIRWIELLELPAEIDKFFFPPDCFSNYRSRI
eukprot:782097-Prymnesium_polylepis.1